MLFPRHTVIDQFGTVSAVLNIITLS